MLGPKQQRSSRVHANNAYVLLFVGGTRYYTRMMHGERTTPPFDDISSVYASMNRTFDFVRPWRSDLWNAITVAITGLDDADVLESIAWNLRSWPLELVNWPVHNSNRTDIRFAPGPNRDFQTHTESVKVLPANERNQVCCCLARRSVTTCIRVSVPMRGAMA